ncbi:MAG: LD-carboxypeptidase [Clostridia bacterium]|nr:LD-carboxypeptidase [Clostridia bacterium]
MIPDRLKIGDEIRVVAPSMSLAAVWDNAHRRAAEFFRDEGFRLTYSAHSREMDRYSSSGIAARVEDLHEAFRDPDVKMILTCLGGFSCNQLLRHLDYDLIAENPKIICGYSDITALLNAIYAKTGLVTYHGPHYSTFGFEGERDYTRQAFFDCLMHDAPFEITPSNTAERYHVIQKGRCEGGIIGGNLCTLNLLQGTPYMPDLRDKVLFLEDDNIMGQYFSYEFDRNLESLLQTYGADSIRGIVLGRFEESCGMTPERIADIIRDKVPPSVPVVCGADFGHVLPIAAFPIGGTVSVSAVDKGVRIAVDLH